MAAINFCVYDFSGLHCCFRMNVPFSFKVSKVSCLHYFLLLLTSMNLEMLCDDIRPSLYTDIYGINFR